MLVETQAHEPVFTYNISQNTDRGDWYWEVSDHGEIIARGLAATETFARADALTATLSHVGPRPENLPPDVEDPLASWPRIWAT